MTGHEQPASVLIEAFRQAQRHVASSVHLITTGSGESRAGMTATAVCSLSFDPLSILVCINRNASIFEHLARDSAFAVNVLSDADAEIATMFGSSKLAPLRFRSGNWRQLGGSPVLTSAVAGIACEPLDHMDVGTHRVLAGRIVAVNVNAESRPLLYHHGAYCSPSTGTPETVAA